MLTLYRFQKLYATNYNIHVIIAGTDINETLQEVPSLFSFEIKIINIADTSKTNQIIALNTAIQNIPDDTDSIIIQDPEIYHANDILSHANVHLKQDNYIIYPVFNIPRFKFNDDLGKISQLENINYINDVINKISYNVNDQEEIYNIRGKGWLQHSSFAIEATLSCLYIL